MESWKKIFPFIVGLGMSGNGNVREKHADSGGENANGSTQTEQNQGAFKYSEDENGVREIIIPSISSEIAEENDEDSFGEETEIVLKEKYGDFKKMLQEYFSRDLREMPADMDTTVFYKTLHPRDIFFYFSPDGKMVVQRFLEEPNVIENVLEVEIVKQEDDSFEYNFNGVGIEDENVGSLIAHSETNPTPERLKKIAQEYSTVEQLFREVEYELEELQDSGQKLNTLISNIRRMENFIKYCDELEEDGHPRVHLDERSRIFLKQKITDYQEEVAFLKG